MKTVDIFLSASVSNCRLVGLAQKEVDAARHSGDRARFEKAWAHLVDLQGQVWPEVKAFRDSLKGA